jgi:hypothetical protein
LFGQLQNRNSIKRKDLTIRLLDVRSAGQRKKRRSDITVVVIVVERDRCSKLPAQIAVIKTLFRSSHEAIVQFFVVTASKSSAQKAAGDNPNRFQIKKLPCFF